MKKIIRVLENIIERITSNVFLKAVSNGMVATITLTMIGSLMGLLINLSFVSGIFHDILVIGIQFSSNLLGLWATFLIGSNLADSYNCNKLNAGVLSILSFFILLPSNAQSMLDLTWIGPRGVVSGIVLSLFISRIYCLIEESLRKRFESNRFSFEISLSAGVMIVIFVSILMRTIILLTPYEYYVFFIGKTVLVFLTSVGGTLPGIIFAVALTNVLFYYGIHGATIVLPFMSPVWVSYGVENLMANAMGQVPPHIIESGLFRIYSEIGGAASLVGFVICIKLVNSKKHYKDLVQRYSITTLSNIGEPMIYGLPLKKNKKLLIPMVLAPTLSIVVAYLSIYFGIVPRLKGISVPNGVPVIVDAFLVGGIPHAILQFSTIIFTTIIYLPFVIKKDKDYESNI